MTVLETVPRFARRHGRLVLLALVVAVVGLAHRRATDDALADDLLLSREPLWVQLAAPEWHATVGPSQSLASRLSRAIDPLSTASTAGDIRAIAAVTTAAGAGLLLLLLRSIGVRLTLAVLLCGAVIGAVLPVASGVSIAHAIQMAAGSGMLLCALASGRSDWARVGALAVLTIVGSLNHASFLAFATAVWSTIWLRPAGMGPRARIGVIGAVSVLAALIAAAAALGPGNVGPAAAAEQPGIFSTIVGLLSGRFEAPFQPVATSDVRTVLVRALPAPLTLTIPLAIAGFATGRSRRARVILGIAATALGAFTIGSWLPDRTVALAPARIAVLVAIGLGLHQLATVPGRAAKGVAVAAALVIGSSGWFAPSRWNAALETRRLQAFVDAAATMVDDRDYLWTADRLSTVRAMLLARPTLASDRIAAAPGALRTAPDDRAILGLADRSAQRASRDVQLAPIDLRYRSAGAFLSFFPDWTWLAVAGRGGARGAFCTELLTRLGVDASVAINRPVALLSRVGRRRPAFLADRELDIPFGTSTEPPPQPVPARFAVATEPHPSIAINGTRTIVAEHGSALALFDPWMLTSAGWGLPTCGQTDAPAIEWSQVGAGLLITTGSRDAAPAIPVVDRSTVAVTLGYDGNEWFGAGWHEPEARDGTPFRWTSQRDADVKVLVSRRQPLRVAVAGELAVAPGRGNSVSLVWNDIAMASSVAWRNESENVWLVPAALVRRGLNVLTLRVAAPVTPAAGGTSADSRRLGLRVTRLTVAPIDAVAADARGGVPPVSAGR